MQIPVPHRRTLLRFTGGAFDHKPRQKPRALACDRGTVKRMPTPDIRQPCDQPLAPGALHVYEQAVSGTLDEKVKKKRLARLVFSSSRCAAALYRSRLLILAVSTISASHILTESHLSPFRLSLSKLYRDLRGSLCARELWSANVLA